MGEVEAKFVGLVAAIRLWVGCCARFGKVEVVGLVLVGVF